jgi:hypothetical protein
MGRINMSFYEIVYQEMGLNSDAEYFTISVKKISQRPDAVCCFSKAHLHQNRQKAVHLNGGMTSAAARIIVLLSPAGRFR